VVREEARRRNLRYNMRCEEKHFNTTAHHPVVKPPATASTAV